MLKKLQAKWKVKGWNLFLIFCTFAGGGSFCGYLGRKILLLTGLEKNVTWFVLYVIIISLLWPFCVLVISLPLGQFSFFKNYIGKIRDRIMHRNTLHLSRNSVTHIAIFASGAGSNARKIIEHFKNNPTIKIGVIVTNKPAAGIVQVAAENNIECLFLTKDEPLDSLMFLSTLKKRHVGVIVLAGFLLKIPASLIQVFPKKIINIHPALLPAYGGKGMYGMHVHEAVILNKEKQSGISIHYVDEFYDHGDIIFQASCDVDENDTAITLSHKIHQLEHTHYSTIIERSLKTQKAS